MVSNSGLKSASYSKTIENVSEEDNEIQLFPNPFTVEVNLRIGNPELVRSIEVLDMLGRQIEIITQGAVQKEQSIGASLKSGMYIIKINGVDKVQLYRLVKK
ncbi:MAG: T9SS type A sorting domain-containing protein [Chloroflexia bacterium]|nr:T9SS type A sorting domain-containing protein [Chloroflexia bacterium]